jgi:hypothetical protein
VVATLMLRCAEGSAPVGSQKEMKGARTSAEDFPPLGGGELTEEAPSVADEEKAQKDACRDRATHYTAD